MEVAAERNLNISSLFSGIPANPLSIEQPSHQDVSHVFDFADYLRITIPDCINSSGTTAHRILHECQEMHASIFTQHIARCGSMI